MKSTSSRFTRLRRAIALLALPVLATPAAFAAFNKTAAGTYDYLDTSNWASGTIDNSFTTTITGNQTITFGSNHTLSGSLSISNTGLFNHTFIGSGANRTLTLGGNISLASTGNANSNTVTIGSATDGQRLNLDVGSANRTVFVGTNRTLDILNTVSSAAGNYNLTKTGAGTLRLTNAANTFSSYVQINEGKLEVTKLTNSGVSSSLGTGTEIRFGGSGGTLSYIGAGDWTNRSILFGGAGAIFDASGTGAIKFTNTAAQANGSTGTARTVTLTGANTDDNTMSTSFANAGSGVVSLLKQGSGRWLLAGNNTYTGDTTIDAGTLELGAADRIANSSNLVLNGGTFATGGFSETLGTLDVNGNATIDLGSGVSALAFADSSGVTWNPSVSLTIINFTEGVDSIRFGNSLAGLTEGQLGQISINGFGAILNSEGYLVAAIPEPSSYALLAGAGGLLVAGFRRRTRAL